MKINQIEVCLVQIPFARSIDHNLKRRQLSESIVIKLTTEEGGIGFGEGAPRSYVTGEDAKTIIKTFEAFLEGASLPEVRSLSEIQNYCKRLSARLPFPSLLTAMEMALLDALGKMQCVNISQYFSKAVPNTLSYSAILPFVSADKLDSWLGLIQTYEFKHLKVKVGQPNDLEVLAKVRSVLGEEIDIRVDANRSWTYAEAIERIKAMETFNISCVEEPLLADEVDRLPMLSKVIDTAIMLDESVYNLTQANYYAQRIDPEKLLFNIKISKSGGLSGADALHRFATSKGIECQLGCNVGETVLLSAAGRIFAQTHTLRYLEGSYAAFFMKDDIGTEAMGFSKKGKATPLAGDGLGVEVDEKKLTTYGNLYEYNQMK